VLPGLGADGRFDSFLGTHEPMKFFIKELTMGRRMNNIKTELEFEGEKVIIETWWDDYSKNYITQIKDEAGNQLGDADFAGEANGARYNHQWMIDHANEKRTDYVDRYF
jgi:hypothetical protein